MIFASVSRRRSSGSSAAAVWRPLRCQCDVHQRVSRRRRVESGGRRRGGLAPRRSSSCWHTGSRAVATRRYELGRFLVVPVSIRHWGRDAVSIRRWRAVLNAPRPDHQPYRQAEQHHHDECDKYLRYGSGKEVGFLHALRCSIFSVASARIGHHDLLCDTTESCSTGHARPKARERHSLARRRGERQRRCRSERPLRRPPTSGTSSPRALAKSI
jgi:hypothetical protein